MDFIIILLICTVIALAVTTSILMVKITDYINITRDIRYVIKNEEKSEYFVNYLKIVDVPIFSSCFEESNRFYNKIEAKYNIYKISKRSSIKPSQLKVVKYKV